MRGRLILFSVIIVLPAIALSYLSWRALRQEQTERSAEIRSRATVTLRTTVLELEAELRRIRERWWKESGADGTWICVRSAAGRAPEPSPPLEERIRRESPELVADLDRAQELEFAKNRRLEACSLYLELESEIESPGTHAALLHARARCGSPEESRAAYERLAREFGSLWSESGIPYGVVAAARLLEMNATPEGRGAFVKLLAKEGLPGHTRAILLRGFPEYASARALEMIEGRVARGDRGPDGVVQVAGRPFLFTFRDTAAAAISLPPFAVRERDGFAFEINTSGDAMTRQSSAEFADVTVSVRLVDPARLRTPSGRMWITGGIVLCLVAALVFGIAAMFRTVRQELRLAKIKGDFVSGVSHDLKTPLTSIRMFAEMLETRGQGGEYAKLIHQESLRLSRIVENVLDFSRIEEGRKSFTFTERSLNELIVSASEAFKTRGVDLTVRVLEEPITAKVDADAIVGAVVNLLDNAVKYGGGKVAVELVRRDGFAEILVTDNGPGVPPEERERIFEKFYRGASAVAGPSGGAGLGLSIVKHAMEAHGGSVSVEGSRFTLRVPLCPRSLS